MATRLDRVIGGGTGGPHGPRPPTFTSGGPHATFTFRILPKKLLLGPLLK